MPSGLGPYFDTSDLGMKISNRNANEKRQLERNLGENEFNSVMEHAKNGTATEEELKRYSIHPVTELKKDARGYTILPKDGIFFPTKEY